MKVKEITAILEEAAPLFLQESYIIAKTKC